MIKYISAFLISTIFVFTQVFFFDLFTNSVKVTLLLICYIMIKDVKKEYSHTYLFFVFFITDLLVFNSPGYMTLSVLLLDYFYDYIGKLFQFNFMFLIEYFSYFLIYFYFMENLFTTSFFINIFMTIFAFAFFLVRKYGFTKIFRI